MSSTDASRIRYVEGLKIPDQSVIAARTKEALDEAKIMASVSAPGGSFVAQLQGQTKYDVLNSALLAELVASEKFNRSNDMEKWYSAYREVLENVGWYLNPPYDSDFINFRSPEPNIMKMADEYMSEGELALFRGMLAIVADRDEHGSTSGMAGFSTKVANFKITPLPDTPQGPAFKNYYYTYYVLPNRNSVFSSRFHGCRQVVVFQESQYRVVRDAIVRKLGLGAVTLVTKVDI